MGLNSSVTYASNQNTQRPFVNVTSLYGGAKYANQAQYTESESEFAKGNNIYSEEQAGEKTGQVEAASFPKLLSTSRA